jgi:hypothetical protein
MLSYWDHQEQEVHSADEHCREKKGFGSVSRRFVDLETDNPGPGTYDHLESSLQSKPESIGKKGFGPMVSNDKRWKQKRGGYTGPGPGEYTLSDNDQEKYFNRAQSTSMFHNPVRTLVPNVTLFFNS